MSAPGPAAGGTLVRDVLVLLVAGAALGLAHNWLQRRGDPTRGLPWIATQRHLAGLPLGGYAQLPGATPGPRASAVIAPARAQVTPAVAKPAPIHRSPAQMPARASVAKSAAAQAAPPPATSSAAPSAADVPNIPESRDATEAHDDVVLKLYTAKAALFVDARSAEEYAAGHIPGAVNLPFDDVFKHPERAKALESQGKPVVCYCDGGDCELSRSLAFALIDAGQRRVLVYLDGWKGWQAAGREAHKGQAP